MPTSPHSSVRAWLLPCVIPTAAHRLWCILWPDCSDIEQDGIVISRSDGRGDFAVPPRAFLVEEHCETRPTSMTEVIRPDYPH